MNVHHAKVIDNKKQKSAANSNGPHTDCHLHGKLNSSTHVIKTFNDIFTHTLARVTVPPGHMCGRGRGAASLPAPLLTVRRKREVCRTLSLP